MQTVQDLLQSLAGSKGLGADETGQLQDLLKAAAELMNNKQDRYVPRVSLGPEISGLWETSKAPSAGMYCNVRWCGLGCRRI